MQHTTARVPTRLDLSGGTLDVWPIHLALPRPAVTVNVALDVGARAEVARSVGDEVVLRSLDQGREERFASPAALQEALAHGQATLPLLAHAVSLGAPDTPLTLTTHATSPAGAGLGGSSALLVAMLGALHSARGVTCPPERLHRLAQDAETRMLGTLTGYQDYQPPIHGGLLALEGAPGGLIVERLDGVDLDALAARLLLVYTGEPHVSGITNWGVAKAYLDGAMRTVEALHAIADTSRAQREALRRGDLDQALALAVEDGRIRVAMAPGVSTPQIVAIDHAARSAGALGTKICGAGGGGCVLLVLPEPGLRAQVEAAVSADPHAGAPRFLPVRLPRGGLGIEIQT